MAPLTRLDGFQNHSLNLDCPHYDFAASDGARITPLVRHKP